MPVTSWEQWWSTGDHTKTSWRCSSQAWPACYINCPVNWADTSAVSGSHLEAGKQSILTGTPVDWVSLWQAFKRQGLESGLINTACPASCFYSVKQENAFTLALIHCAHNEERDAPRDCLFNNTLLGHFFFRTTKMRRKQNKTEERQSGEAGSKAPLKTSRMRWKPKEGGK